MGVMGFMKFINFGKKSLEPINLRYETLDSNLDEKIQQDTWVKVFLLDENM